MRRIGSSAMEPLQGCSSLPPERRKPRFVHEHDAGGRDDVAKPPAQRAEVPRLTRLNRQSVVRSLTSQHPFVPRLRGRMDRDDHEPLAERLSEHLEFYPTAEAFDDDTIPVDSRQRALRRDSESVGLTLCLGHPADRGIRDGEASALGYFAYHVPIRTIERPRSFATTRTSSFPQPGMPVTQMTLTRGEESDARLKRFLRDGLVRRYVARHGTGVCQCVYPRLLQR